MPEETRNDPCLNVNCGCCLELKCAVCDHEYGWHYTTNDGNSSGCCEDGPCHCEGFEIPSGVSDDDCYGRD